MMICKNGESNGKDQGQGNGHWNGMATQGIGWELRVLGLGFCVGMLRNINIGYERSEGF